MSFVIRLLTRRKSAVLGVIVVGAAVAVSSFGVVRAERAHPEGHGIFNCSSGIACVDARSTAHGTLGVLGISSGEGIEGVTFSASGKAGVRGASRGTTGLGYGVIGMSANGDGVAGVSTGRGSAGVLARSDKGDGADIQSSGPGEVALRAHAVTQTTGIFIGTNGATLAHCVIDAHANLGCTGNLRSDGMVESAHRDGFGRRVIAYAPESATATIEDVGTGRLVDGVANVRIDPALAAMMDHGRYYVFVTPLGDTRGLYVSRKGAAGFQVREVERGRASLDFDYRIVAHPIDASNDRLPSAASDDLPAR
jgi:hypothetical protein